MSDVRPVGIVDEEGFAAPAPCKIEDLLGSVAQGAVVEGVDDVEGGREAKFVIEERAPEGVAVLDGAADVEQGMKEVFVFISWRPYNSFFCQHGKLEQMINSIVFLIVNIVLYFSTQPEIKMTNFILHFLMNTSMNHTLLQLSIIVLDRHISLV
jgi:hypothetical protein